MSFPMQLNGFHSNYWLVSPRETRSPTPLLPVHISLAARQPTFSLPSPSHISLASPRTGATPSPCLTSHIPLTPRSAYSHISHSPPPSPQAIPIPVPSLTTSTVSTSTPPLLTPRGAGGSPQFYVPAPVSPQLYTSRFPSMPPRAPTPQTPRRRPTHITRSVASTPSPQVRRIRAVPDNDRRSIRVHQNDIYQFRSASARLSIVTPSDISHGSALSKPSEGSCETPRPQSVPLVQNHEAAVSMETPIPTPLKSINNSNSSLTPRPDIRITERPLTATSFVSRRSTPTKPPTPVVFHTKPVKIVEARSDTPLSARRSSAPSARPPLSARTVSSQGAQSIETIRISCEDKVRRSPSFQSRANRWAKLYPQIEPRVLPSSFITNTRTPSPCRRSQSVH